MAEPAVIKAQSRPQTGSRNMRRLRHTGLIPVTLYQAGKPSLNLAAGLKDLQKALLKQKENRLITLEIEGAAKKSHPVIIKEIQRDTIKNQIIHMDLESVEGKSKVIISLPVKAVGEPIGVKLENGVLAHLIHNLRVKADPKNLPLVVVLDVSDMHKGQFIKVKDLPKKDYQVLDRPDNVVLTVTGTRAIVEEKAPEEAAVPGAEGAVPGAEGAAVPGAPGAAPAAPGAAPAAKGAPGAAPPKGAPGAAPPKGAPGAAPAAPAAPAAAKPAADKKKK